MGDIQSIIRAFDRWSDMCLIYMEPLVIDRTRIELTFMSNASTVDRLIEHIDYIGTDDVLMIMGTLARFDEYTGVCRCL